MRYYIRFCLFIFLCLPLVSCTSKETQITSYRYREEKEELPKCEALQDNIPERYGELRDSVTDSEGNLYLLYVEDETSKQYVIRYETESEDYEELSMNLEGNHATFVAMDVMEEGILLYDTVRAYLYREGEGESSQDFPCWPRGGRVFPGDETIICQVHSDSPYYSIDLQTGKSAGVYLEEEFVFAEGRSIRPFLDDSSGVELLRTGAGIYEHIEEEWILQVPASKTSLMRTGLFLQEMGKEGDNYYFIDREHTYRFFLEEVQGELEETNLVVSACRENYTLNNALVAYQIEHPEITIEYRFQITKEPESIQEMSTLRQKINTEISSRQAADLYVLDYLPWESYKEKGYLSDLSSIVESYAKQEGYFRNILRINETEEGLYTVPWFFHAQFVMCTKELTPYVRDIHSLAAYLEEHPEEPGLVPMNYRDRPDLFLSMMYHFYGDALIKGEPILEEIKDFLSSAQVIYDRQQENSSATMATGYTPRYEMLADCPDLEELYLLQVKKEGNLVFYPCTAKSVIDLCQAFHYPGYDLVPVGGIQARTLLGIHSQSTNQEEAGKLLAYLLTYFKEYGKEDSSVDMFFFLQGIPIYQEPLKKWLAGVNLPDKTQEYEKRIAFGEEYLYFSYTEQDMEQVTGLLDSFTATSVSANLVYNDEYGLFMERSRGFLTGERSLEETAAEIYDGLLFMHQETQ